MNALVTKSSKIKLSSHVRKLFYSTREFAKLLGKSEKNDITMERRPDVSLPIV